jgi:hypothetical protein
MKAAIECVREGRVRELERLRYLAGDVRRVRIPGTRPALIAAYEADLREGLAKRHDFARAIALLEAAPVVMEIVRAARRLVLETGGRAAALDVVSPDSRRKLQADEMLLRNLLADPLVQKLIAEGE